MNDKGKNCAKRKSDELLDIIDKKGNVIGSGSRSSLHNDPTKIHMTTNILIVNLNREVLVQMRSRKKRYGGGIWEISAGGHVDKGETPDKCAKRELEEELGIQTKLHYIDKKVFRFDNESELAHLYFGRSEGPFKFDREEIEKIKFVKYSRLKNFLKCNRIESMLQLWLPKIESMKEIIFKGL